MTTESITDTAEKNSRSLSSKNKAFILLLIGLLLGALLTTAIRFALAKDTTVHHHANFALYINGQKDDFKSFAFYEEVAACDASSLTNPRVRTHLHDSNSSLIHVHDGGVTWGQFFENISYGLGNDFVKTGDGIYVDGQNGNTLTFTLNGKDTNIIANEVINSEDVLLINYGSDSSGTLKDRYDQIPRDAGKANVTKDPSACAGGHEFTFTNRLKEAIGLPTGKH